MIVLYIFLILLVIIMGMILFIFIVSDSYEDYIIRINEANASIESILNKKFDLLKKSNDIIKKITNSEDDKLKTIENIRSSKLNNIELDKELDTAIKELKNISEDDDNIKNNQDYTNIEIELSKSEIESIALKKYYNDIANKYNKMIIFPPYKLVARIKKYEVLELFNIDNQLDENDNN